MSVNLNLATVVVFILRNVDCGTSGRVLLLGQYAGCSWGLHCTLGVASQ